MNLVYLRFWSGNLVVFVVRSLTAYSDRQVDEWRGQNLRENGDEWKNEQKWTYSIRDSDQAVL